MPSLGELLSRFLQQQTAAHAAGVASPESGEVTPFEAGMVQPVEPRLAWKEATAALAFYPKMPALKPPVDWSALIAAQESITAVPFCVGNFPQLLRDWQALLNVTDLTALQPHASRPTAIPSALEWAEQTARDGRFPSVLLALGACRLARQFDMADRLAAQIDPNVPTEWQAAWANERAALTWRRGQADEAARAWAEQPDSVPVHFNRGMSALFLNRAADARGALRTAVDQLPADGAWHHLGRLYLALAEMRTG